MMEKHNHCRNLGEEAPMIHVGGITLMLALLATPASADQWITSDGCISIATPDLTRFTAMESSPPISVSWISQDGDTILTLAENEYPAGMKLQRSAVESSLTSTTGGKIVETSVEDLSGYEVYSMTAHNAGIGSGVYVTAKIVAIDGRVYKLMATSDGVDTRVDPDVSGFISSFRILKTKPRDRAVVSPVSTSPRPAPPQAEDRGGKGGTGRSQPAALYWCLPSWADSVAGYSETVGADRPPKRSTYFFALARASSSSNVNRTLKMYGSSPATQWP
jgi:hypothetical protein